MKDIIKEAILQSGFDIVHEVEQDTRVAKFASYEDMNISEHAKQFVRDYGISNLWTHQRKAVETALNGKNVCVSTSTSSGKTEIFQMTAIDILERNPQAKVLAIYSAKALNSQQKDRWNKTNFTIGQIDGSNSNIAHRLETLKNSRVVVMTPDVMHAFLLGKLNNTACSKTILDFIKNIELVIIDEIHLYRGVFGTNSAYLFRRFNNIRRALRKDQSYPLYITASATLPNPGEHSSNITGAGEFVNIGKTEDGSPISKTHFFYIQPISQSANEEGATRPSVAQLALNIAQDENTKSITFVESRQKTGEVVLAMGDSDINLLEENKIYPYRAGMEEDTREKILNRMQTGDFKGIVSTSALEIGIDIDGLNVAIIANIPYDRNSYYQRIGRVGRGSCPESFVIIVNDGSFKANLLFYEYDFDIDKLLPDLEPSLYLDSKDVQYVHASCHSDFDKECCELRACGCGGFDNTSRMYFPKSFCDICLDIATRQTTKDYDRYADIEDPHHHYSLRNSNSNYSFVNTDNTEIQGESVNRQQMLKEAYKGAIRNITHQRNQNITLHNQEVVLIDKVAKTIMVRDFTNRDVKSKPLSRTLVYPNFSKDRRFNTCACGDARFYNLELYENTTIKGYQRILFKNSTSHEYDHPFIDTLRTTGVIMFHPALQAPHVCRKDIAKLIFEAFLLQNAFDRNDISHNAGKLYTPNKVEGLDVDDRFVAFYDINQLNITSNLLKEDILKNIFLNIANHLDTFASSIFDRPLNIETRIAIENICSDILENEMVSEKCITQNSYIDVYTRSSPVLFYEKYESEIDEDTIKEQTVEELNLTPATILSIEKADIPNRVRYTIMDHHQNLRFDIPEEALKPTEDSRFSKYDWEQGIVVRQ